MLVTFWILPNMEFNSTVGVLSDALHLADENEPNSDLRCDLFSDISYEESHKCPMKLIKQKRKSHQIGPLNPYMKK